MLHHHAFVVAQRILTLLHRPRPPLPRDGAVADPRLVPHAPGATANAADDRASTRVEFVGEPPSVSGCGFRSSHRAAVRDDPAVTETC